MENKDSIVDSIIMVVGIIMLTYAIIISSNNFYQPFKKPPTLEKDSVVADSIRLKLDSVALKKIEYGRN